MKKYFATSINEFLKADSESRIVEGTEYEMVISQLNQIHKFSKMIADSMQPGMEVPAWIQSQIAVSANDINGIYQYLEGQKLTDNTATPEKMLQIKNA